MYYLADLPSETAPREIVADLAEIESQFAYSSTTRARRVYVEAGRIQLPAVAEHRNELVPGDPSDNWGNGERIALCVHGILSGPGKFYSFREFLKDEGYDEVWYFRYNYSRSIEDNATSLVQLVTQKISNSQQKIDIFAHSMGGLVSRYAIEQYGMYSAVDIGDFWDPSHGITARQPDIRSVTRLTPPERSGSWR
jgi:triacylglycerol esterase/lipase EstA (alpha/beta hydrolase family)